MSAEFFLIQSELKYCMPQIYKVRSLAIQNAPVFFCPTCTLITISGALTDFADSVLCVVPQ